MPTRHGRIWRSTGCISPTRSLFFDDGSAVTISDPDAEDEERWVTIGRDAFDRLLVVVYTWRGPNIRLISVRKANRREEASHQR